MHIIALTGNSGSGKSTLCELFAFYHVDTLSADHINRELLASSHLFSQLFSKIAGQELSRGETQLIDIDLLRSLLFNSDDFRQKITSILHPVIFENIKLQLSLLENKTYCIVEIPLLFESNSLYSFIDSILLITAPTDRLLSAIASRPNLDINIAKAILKTQLSDEHKFPQSSNIVINDKDLKTLQKTVATLHLRFTLSLK